MRVITKIKMFGTLVALIGVFAAFQIATGNITKDNNDDNYVASVSWSPGVLSIQRPVTIKLSVDGVPMVTKVLHVSPWSETMTVVPQARVSLVAQTGHPSLGKLDCILLRNGRTVSGSGFDSWTAGTDPAPAAVSCTA